MTSDQLKVISQTLYKFIETHPGADEYRKFVGKLKEEGQIRKAQGL